MATRDYICKECGKEFSTFTAMDYDEGHFDDSGNPECNDCLGVVKDYDEE